MRGDIVVPLSKGLLRVRAPHLFVGHRDQPVLGQLPHHAEVRPHVQLAAHQHHFGARTELLRLPLPLWRSKHEHFYNRCLITQSDVLHQARRVGNRQQECCLVMLSEGTTFRLLPGHRSVDRK